ncbi:hypothetical protein Ancab_001484 [Ancistrocladus abbreviatus]
MSLKGRGWPSECMYEKVETRPFFWTFGVGGGQMSLLLVEGNEDERSTDMERWMLSVQEAWTVNRGQVWMPGGRANQAFLSLLLVEGNCSVLLGQCG